MKDRNKKMQLFLKRVFKEPIEGTKCFKLKNKTVEISKCNAQEFLDLVCTVMAQEDTLRIIIERENK